jgi:mitotic-spindle organizing protein 1
MDTSAGVRDLETVYEISRLLNTGLDRETLSILVSLCENGVNPEALAAVVRELRREAKAVVRTCMLLHACWLAGWLACLLADRGGAGVRRPPPDVATDAAAAARPALLPACRFCCKTAACVLRHAAPRQTVR